MLEIYDELSLLSSLVESMKISNEMFSFGQKQQNELYSYAYNYSQTYLLEHINNKLNAILKKIETEYLKD